MANDSDLSTTIPYRDSMEQLQDYLKLLDLRIRMALIKQQLAARAKDGQNPPQYKGLFISYEHIINLFSESAEVADEPGAVVKHLEELLERQESAIGKRTEGSKARGIFLALEHISRVFGLNGFERQSVLVCLAVELDRKYEKAYGFLQDDITIKNPTVWLILQLFCHDQQEYHSFQRYLDQGGKLDRYFWRHDGATDGKAAGLSRELRLEYRIVSYLLDNETTDPHLDFFTTVFTTEADLPSLLFHGELQQKIQNYARYFGAQDPVRKKKLIFYLWGPPGVGKTLQAKHWCRSVGKALLVVDLSKINPEYGSFSGLLNRIAREAILRDAVICFQKVDTFLGAGDEPPERDRNDYERRLDGFRQEILAMPDWHPGIYFWLAERPFRHDYDPEVRTLIPLELAFPDNYQRKQYWEYFSREYAFREPIDWGTMGSKFRFTPGQIREVLTTAQIMASWHFGEKPVIHLEELYQTCYAKGHHQLSKKAVRITPRYIWEDLILPGEPKTQLKNACNQIKHRYIVFQEWGFDRKLSYGKGLSILFSGPPGTGKTMAAQVFANELDLEIYKIDISQLVSKYIGETEKNINEVFDGAQRSNAILFFDEADALFGKRSEVKDSHDRYSNIETAYLLQKIEEYEGVSILATNFVKNIDEAFLRRFNFVIDFPFPDAGYREKIWRTVFPKETPLDPDLDFQWLAGKFEVSGGNIKNIAVNAAFLAAENYGPVGVKHIVRAAKYEIHKSGKIFSQENMEEYYEE